MKIRTDFVTNSSSSSFVINLENVRTPILKEKIKSAIFQYCTPVTVDQIDCMYSNCDFDDIYYLIDYDSADTELHVWVTRDESMNNEELDPILYEWDDHRKIAKWDNHY